MTVIDPLMRTLETPFGTVTILEQGAGRPLLYLHGVGDAGGMIPAIARVGAHRRIIRPDHPGFLRSSDSGAESPRDLADWYAQQLAAWDLDDIDLVGCSLGGWIAAELALLSPDRIRTLTLIDPAGLDDDGDMPNIFTLTPAETVLRTFATDAFRSAAPPPPETAELLARSRATAKRIAADPYMHDPTLGARLAKLTMPTTLVWGAQDGIIPVAVAESWRRAIPHAELTIIDDAGHLPHLEQPDAFAATTCHWER